MSRAWVFTLPYQRAPKGLSANDRPHWQVKRKSTADVRQIVAHWCLRLINEPLERCRVDVEWVVTTRHRRDTDNLAPFLKAIYDGIGADRGVSAHLVCAGASGIIRTGGLLHDAEQETRHEPVEA